MSHYLKGVLIARNTGTASYAAAASPYVLVVASLTTATTPPAVKNPIVLTAMGNTRRGIEHVLCGSARKRF